jgi:hypothetical protein
MYKNAAVLLVEVLDGLCFRVKFYGSGNRRCELFVWEIDACKLGVESRGDDGAE